MTNETPAEQIPNLPPSESAAASSSVEHRAWAEAEFFSRGASTDELESEARRNEHGRNQRFRNNFEWVAIAALWIAAAAVLAVGSIWLWHLIAPSKWRWLKTDDVSHLQSIVTAGLLVGVIGNHFKKRLG